MSDKIRRDDCVDDLAAEMKRVLDENSHKSGWDDMTIHELFNRLEGEMGELREEYFRWKHVEHETKENFTYMRKELIDVANFVAFFRHRVVHCELTCTSEKRGDKK